MPKNIALIKRARPTCILYHNPRCSKSRATLELLQARGVEPEVILYLKTPPSVAQLKALLGKLKLKPIELLRKGEEEYQTHVADKQLSDAQLLALMAQYPVLIGRPILVVGDQAALCRPPENALPLLGLKSLLK